MALQMTLYGPVERFILETYQPEFLLSEHHALIDTLAYGAFYTRMVRAAVDRARFEAPLRERLAAAGPGAFEAIERWHARENGRLGEEVPLWSLGLHVCRLLEKPREEMIPALARRYRSRLPDVVLLLDLPAQVAVERLAKRGGAHAELHEQAGFLEQLRKSYHEVIQYLGRAHPEVQTYVIDTAASQGVDETLREVLRKSGMVA
jgi:hypothetical protein